MPQDTPKTKVYIDVTLSEEEHGGCNVVKLTATLTVPDSPLLACHATMTAYASEVFGPYRSKNGGPERPSTVITHAAGQATRPYLVPEPAPEYPFKVITYATHDTAVLEAVETVEQPGQGTLLSNFEQIISDMRGRRTRPVA